MADFVGHASPASGAAAHLREGAPVASTAALLTLRPPGDRIPAGRGAVGEARPEGVLDPFGNVAPEVEHPFRRPVGHRRAHLSLARSGGRAGTPGFPTEDRSGARGVAVPPGEPRPRRSAGGALPLGLGGQPLSLRLAEESGRRPRHLHDGLPLEAVPRPDPVAVEAEATVARVKVGEEGTPVTNEAPSLDRERG